MTNYQLINIPNLPMTTSIGGRGRSTQQTGTIMAFSPNHVSAYQSKRQPRYSIKIVSNCQDPYCSMVDKMRKQQNLSNPTCVNIKSGLLSSLSNLSLNNALFVIDKALSQCSNFHHCYGYSDFDLNLCQFSSAGELKIKILRDSPKKQTDQTIIVDKILKQIYSLCAPKVLHDFISYFNRNKLKTKCNFKCTRSLIKAYCACSKIQPQTKLHFSHHFNANLLQPSSYKSVERTPSIQSSQGKIRKDRRMTFGNYDKENEGQTMLSSRIKYKFGSLKDKVLQKTQKQIEPNNLFNTKLSKSSLMLPQNNLKVPSIISSNGKGSQTSTNPRTSGNHSTTKENCLDLDSLQEAPSTGIENASLFQFQFPIIDKPLLQTSLSEVESHYESCSDHNFSPDGKNQQNNKILQHQWIQKIDIFATTKQINESFSEGKEEVAQIIGSNPQNLGKMARVICESCLLTSPSGKKAKQDQ